MGFLRLRSLQLYKWSDRIVKTVERKDWLTRNGNFTKTVHMIVTPKVKVIST